MKNIKNLDLNKINNKDGTSHFYILFSDGEVSLTKSFFDLYGKNKNIVSFHRNLHCQEEGTGKIIFNFYKLGLENIYSCCDYDFLVFENEKDLFNFKEQEKIK
jgi:hypothetical protein